MAARKISNNNNNNPTEENSNEAKDTSKSIEPELTETVSKKSENISNIADNKNTNTETDMKKEDKLTVNDEKNKDNVNISEKNSTIVDNSEFKSKSEDNWGNVEEKKCVQKENGENTESGWGVETNENTEGGWGVETNENADGGWGDGDSKTADNVSSLPVNERNTSNTRAEAGYIRREEDRQYRDRSYDKYNTSREGRGSYRSRPDGEDEYPRKRYDRGEGDFGQDKRHRNDREEGYGSRNDNFVSRNSGYGSRERNYSPREDHYGTRERNYYQRDEGYSRDRSYPPREEGYYRERSYPPREEGYSRDRGYPPRDEGYYRERNYPQRGQRNYMPRENGYERNRVSDNYNRNLRSTYDPMAEDSGKSYEQRPKKVIPENVPPSKALGLFGLSLYATEDDLREFLNEELIDIKDFKITIICDHTTRKSKGFGFVYFQSLEDSIRAKELLTGKAIKGKEIRVDFSVSDALRPNYR
ncbi:transformer-2 protein-like protein beta [Vairimorpha apis BRL 01]|uniref:Transformer-2 protein-like protein beta n=1 Tax=Vairimorpha apis BRL 01 TaxID=1037528 RepID=T0MI88_9MICR|nr:transformer-2 protein-like protein beta [Vairimorpha apis BRL 01]